ncbi:MAG: tRNA pseudouridine13 synthase [Phenylobacterium sp.]|jgi:tRNA pseudouridine13 synthase
MTTDNPVAALAYLHGQPLSQGDIKTSDADFVVEEVLGFELSGEGEHVCLFIEKQGENTLYVARQIARIAGVRQRDVSYSGLKDRHAITRQWFCVPVGIKKTVDWSELETDAIRILQQTRHSKKLRTGSHRANKFNVLIAQITDMADVEQRLGLIEQTGVPNYFAAQRFGFGGNNLKMAERLFGGESIKDRKLKGLVLSAARSHLFNLIVSERVKQQRFDQPMDGDLFRLDGTRSFFSETITSDILARLKQADIHIAASMVGDGDWLTTQDARVFEQAVLQDYQGWIEGLKAMRVAADSRPIQLNADAFSYDKIDATTIRLNFTLPTGSFATALLREVIDFNDCGSRHQQSSSADE